MKEGCTHCGELCDANVIGRGTKRFCCVGCSAVYSILFENNMLEFYARDSDAGMRVDPYSNSDYRSLDEPSVAEAIYDFDDGETARVRLHLPNIHCSACLWLLENLHRIDAAVIRSQVNFGKKEALIFFKRSDLSLRELAELLKRIGYPPAFNRASAGSAKADRQSGLYLRMGISGFLFGNIMLMSFPEYLTKDPDILGKFGHIFGYANLLLAIPALLVGARSYFIASWKALLTKRISIDVPIALGIGAIFMRSAYEVLSQSGAGYFDSMAGLIFFLLIGKWYQSRVHGSLSFDHDHQAYFPLAVQRVENGKEESILIGKLEIGDMVSILPGGIIPADSVLLSANAVIDNSFITGESRPCNYKEQDLVYAGARNTEQRIELRVKKKVDQSYLTSLWNAPAFSNEKQMLSSTLQKAATYFTIAILLIAIGTFAYWSVVDPNIRWSAFCAVLIVACPCALALTIPFTLGHARYVLGKNGFYARNIETLETLAGISTVVLDKTGTITTALADQVEYHGEALSDAEWSAVRSLANESAHPYSRSIYAFLEQEVVKPEAFEVTLGEGISGVVNGISVRIARPAESSAAEQDPKASAQGPHIFLNGVAKGCFSIRKELRKGVDLLIPLLKRRARLHLLSGDDRQEEKVMRDLFGSKVDLHFDQRPEDKMAFIEKLQASGERVLMMGDGLNDAGAFQQSDVGIAVSENIHLFSPACDVILDADKLRHLDRFWAYTKASMKVVRTSILLSLLYNIVGISFATQGLLTPVLAAILMPLSSISIMVFGTAGSYFQARKFQLLVTTVREGSKNTEGRGSSEPKTLVQQAIPTN